MSDDGRWWFDGAAWLPAVSQDGRFKFNGASWERTGTQSRRRATFLLCAAVAMVLAWTVAVMIGFVFSISAPEYPGEPTPEWVDVLVTLTVGWGGVVWLTLLALLVILALRHLHRASPRRFVAGP